MKIQVQEPNRPNLKARIFTFRKLEDIDWKKERLYVIEEVLHYGTPEDYEEIIRFYGRENVIHALTREKCYIKVFYIDFVAEYFGIPKEELWEYKRLERRKKLIPALHLYGFRKISLSEGAEVSGLSLAEFLEELKAWQIPHSQPPESKNAENT